ncbi:hypothetical protein ACQKWADRAFT_143315 [Trichoderma austrokoningii]
MGEAVTPGVRIRKTLSPAATESTLRIALTSRDGGWRHVSKVLTSRQYRQSHQSPRRAIDSRRMAIPAPMRSHPCKSMQPLLRRRCLMYLLQRQGWEPGASPPLARPKKGSRQKLLCGGAVSATGSPATKASVPGRRDSAHTSPSDSHWPRTSRARPGIETVAAAASSLTSTDPPPALHLVRHAGSPEACEPQGRFAHGHFRPALQPAAACSALARKKRIEGGRSRIHSSV